MLASIQDLEGVYSPKHGTTPVKRMIFSPEPVPKPTIRLVEVELNGGLLLTR